MPAIQNVYRRGAVYWFRVNLLLKSGICVGIRVSLGTSNAREARRIGAIARAASGGAVQMLNAQVSESGYVPDKALTALGKRFYEDMLGHLRVKHAQVPCEMAPRINRGMLDMITLVSAVGKPCAMTDDLTDFYREEAGFCEERITDLTETLTHYDGGATAPADDVVAHYCRSVGLDPTSANIRDMRFQLLPFLQDALGEAQARLETTGTMRPLAQQGMPAGPVATAAYQPAHTQQAPAPAKTLPISVAAQKFTTFRGERGTLHADSIGQVLKAVDLFVFANGDLDVTEIQQHHLGKLLELFVKLPKTYGRTRAEIAGGLEASLVRAASLDPERVGLSSETINKHLTWLKQVITYCRSSLGVRPAEAIEFTDCRQSTKGRAKNKKRLSWKDDELALMFRQPNWTGCAGLFNRLEPGSHIWHDAWYFGPIGLALHGMRSDEFLGLSLAEVHEDAPIPYISLQTTKFRRLKNEPSIRDLPISTELIRLGFLDYVRELRRLGKDLVFPEMQSPARTMGFDSVFYRVVFDKLRAHCFPEGTDWYRRNGGLKEKDVHSLRGSTANLMLGKVETAVREDVLGHRGTSETRETYDEAAELVFKLEAISTLSFLTAHLEPKPLNLRPTEWLSYGQPAGRSANSREAVPKRLLKARRSPEK